MISSFFASKTKHREYNSRYFWFSLQVTDVPSRGGEGLWKKQGVGHVQCPPALKCHVCHFSVQTALDF